MSSLSSLVLLFFCFCQVSLLETLSNGLSVELIHYDSLKSSIYNPGEKDRFQRVSNLVHHSTNRANYLKEVLSVSPNIISQTTMTRFTGNGYVMSYSIGTPPLKLYAGFDTGSSFIWFQCKPCAQCNNQTSPMFDPLKFSTYKSLPCTSTACNYRDSIGITHCSSNNQRQCEYNIAYGDHTYSIGALSVDTFTLNSTNGSTISFSSFVVGCGHENQATFGGKISGIIGFGRGHLSFVSQLDSTIGGKFSYCLVPLFSDTKTLSKLYFGDEAVVSGPETVSTPLQDDPTGPYVVNLEAFSVGNNIIKVGPLGFKNTLIDAGSTFTYLPDDVYHKLESTVASMVKLKRVKDPTHNLSLCYETTFKELEVPIIIAHFDGGDIHLNAQSTFIPVGHKIVCFAFSPSHFLGTSIFGNIMQQNLLVGFDLRRNTVSFKPTDCTKL